jgi:hypothetical protein
MVTEYPLACNNLASEAEIMPLPSEDVTPPVTKMYFVVGDDTVCLIWFIVFYINFFNP